MLIKSDNILFPKPGPRARRGIRDSRGMSSYDARFHQTFQCLSLNVKGRYWERDIAEHEVWLHNWRQHQVKAGVVRALERGSRLRIPRRRASPMLKSSWSRASTRGWLVDTFCAWLKWDYDSQKLYSYLPPPGVVINIKNLSWIFLSFFLDFLRNLSWTIWCFSNVSASTQWSYSAMWASPITWSLVSKLSSSSLLSTTWSRRYLKSRRYDSGELWTSKK